MAPADEPRPIRRLAEDVVNRVAAGEVIHRPSSALKELLENALDAGATAITVTVKDGGCKLLQVTDDGVGIRENDLAILCERHTTSKLATFEDLNEVATFGFRGEALASMSFVANLTVTTMTKDAPHALKASYRDGVLENGAAMPCAGVKGTTIAVENLFYNVPTRRKALRSPTEEYNRIVDVVQRYASSRTATSFVIRKLGEARPALHCPVATERVDRLRAVYGAAVAKELTPLRLNVSMPGAGAGGLRFALDALISSSSYHSKKSTFVLFINDRLVECAGLKRAIEAVYAAVLPKAEKPFVYAALTLPPRAVDVNVHPTKREVHFLHQDELIDEVQRAVEGVLRGANASRTFSVGTVVGGGEGGGGKRAKTGTRDKPAYEPRKLVRTDARLAAGSMEAFVTRDAAAGAAAGADAAARLDEARRSARERSFGDVNASAGGAPGMELDDEERALRGEEEEEEIDAARAEARAEAAAAAAARAIPDGQTTELTSVRELWRDIAASAHEGLTAVVRKLTLVGPADANKALWLVQHGTKLFLVRARRMAREFFYQRAIARFGTHPRRALSSPAPLAEMVRMALEAEKDDGEGASAGDEAAAANAVAALLVEKAPMLREYFSVDIDEDAKTLVGLPVLLEGHTPDVTRVPEFILSLAHEVDWKEEKACFKTVAAALAEFYGGGGGGDDDDGNGDGDENAAETDDTRAWRLVLFPGMMRHLRPSAALATGGGILQVACLEQLYRVFERC
ncbi:DNA mismatch repair and recombination [Micromonas pusilla CCMP1545]|uniref:DNA mismatch repair and recombination n=2 Tax=Micromonas pusilla TaxID=38833 RepID=C1MZI9_MICPC|nr:DNA mismatch repair and recombination [Micromonas pusilla CCMP1545]EEH54877.1 DNA mismatch repair and recombination [Micromonas pusilla CCMP1545]|eukprot:XP_003061227.1 DNA mismatch repair and recombination [Micromonas pusilla CCMP1545]